MKTLVLAAVLTALSYACFTELDADAVLEARVFSAPAAGTCGGSEPVEPAPVEPAPVPAALASPGCGL